MSQKEAEVLMSLLCLPSNTTFSTDEIRTMLEGTGLPSLIHSRLKKKKPKPPQEIPLTALQPAKRTIKKPKPIRYRHTPHTHSTEIFGGHNQRLRRNNTQYPQHPYTPKYLTPYPQYQPHTNQPRYEEDWNSTGYINNIQRPNPTKTYRPYTPQKRKRNDTQIHTLNTIEEGIEIYTKQRTERNMDNAEHRPKQDIQLNYINVTELELKLKTYKDGTVSIRDFITMQEIDEEIDSITNKTENQNGILCIKYGEELMPILPKALAKSYITSLHFSPDNCHMSTEQIKRKIKQKFHLHNMNEKVKELTSGCPFCTLSIVYRQPRHIYQHSAIPKAPRQHYWLDLIGGLNESKGYRFIYAAVCAFSGYTILKSARGKSAREIQNFILFSIINPHGVFRTLSMDQEWGPELSTDFEAFLDRYGITKNISAVATHFTNGTVERIVSKIKEAARKLNFQTRYEWSDIIGLINSSINKTVLTYGFSSEQVLYGHELNNSWAPLTLEQLNDNIEEYYNTISQITREAQKSLKTKG